MDFVVIFGPPAVGKMTVGRALCEWTGFKLFHNHMSVEPISDIFEFGSPSYQRLVHEIRHRVVEEAVSSDLRGLVFTCVWALDDQADADFVASLAATAERGGATVRYVELAAGFEERRRRNKTELRREHKRTHRDEELSERILLDLERSVLNTDGAVVPAPAAAALAGRDHLRIDNTDLTPAEVARQVAERFGLPGAAPGLATG